MFPATHDKLEDARSILEGRRQATDARTFRSTFNSFLHAARAVTNALQKEGYGVDGFAAWYAGKQDEMRTDELLRFFHEARTDDFHEGKHRLSFSTHVGVFVADQAGQPPTPTAALVFGADGIYWLVDEGTPNQRRVPVTQGGSFTTRVAMANPPQSHLGKRLRQTDPLALCGVVTEYLATLVHEADRAFAPAS